MSKQHEEELLKSLPRQQSLREHMWMLMWFLLVSRQQSLLEHIDAKLRQETENR